MSTLAKLAEQIHAGEGIELIYSSLSQTDSAEGHTLLIEIYRGAGEPWILEIEEEIGTSTVWSDHFETDTAALAAAFEATEAEGGVHASVTDEPELLRRLS
ncbi:MULTISPECIES: hypothetical protein [unclassified Roseateles]|uniref:hypothetical protein n=1 Tax=unclassified Roseateles TaxID=2626991 RepID=UPI000700EF88|nr:MULTISPECIES: hypothetical protein [unclassified Roseateles]KQW42019.1 hypothetical protein ASC81_22180 [Pelomonas sp. Root405]KRA67622.1 hypothetical protein ASD88_23765 [Pelomonas sp. Root662]